MGRLRRLLGRVLSLGAPPVVEAPAAPLVPEAKREHLPEVRPRAGKHRCRRFARSFGRQCRSFEEHQRRADVVATNIRNLAAW